MTLHLSAQLMSGRSCTLVLAACATMAMTHRAAHAQVSDSQLPRPIASVVAQRNPDSTYTIAGRAVVGSGKLQSGVLDVAIEDASGGIRIFSRSPQPAIAEGDSVTATGRINVYRGNIELAATRVVVVRSAPRRTMPRDVSIDTAMLATHAGQLVRVNGRVVGVGRSEGGEWARLDEGNSSTHSMLTVWVPANHGAPIDLMGLKAGDGVVVTGIVTAYRDNNADPVVWQIVPRDSSDVTLGSTGARLPTWILWLVLAAVATTVIALSVGRLGARRQLRALRETEVRYRQLLALLPDAVIVHADGEILFTNPAAAKLLGISSEGELAGKRVEDFVHADSLTVLTAAGSRDSAGETIPRVRAKMLNAASGTIDVEVASSPCVYHDRSASVLLARDITAQLRYERDLHALALVDELTGLQNRRAFTLFAEQELARARRNGSRPVLVFADLDGLKRINDEYGHAAGDAAIRIVATALRSIFRETDVVARWSGDEFVALMAEGSEEAAHLIRRRLDAAIMTQAPPLPYVVTASVGASPLDPALPLRDAMERADAELYAQKKRNRRSKVRATPPIALSAIIPEN